MKKVLLVLLWTSLLFPCFLLSGCDRQDQQNTQDPQILRGHYKATADMKEQMNKGMGGIIRVDKLDVVFHLNLVDDSNYHLYTEEDQVKDSITAALTDALKDSLSEKEIRDLVDNLDPSSLAISKEGTYEVQSDDGGRKSIVFDPDSESSQTGEISEDFSTIKTILEMDDSQSLELVFKKGE